MLGLFGWFFGLLSLGVPVAFVLGASATLYMLNTGDIPLRVVPARLFAGLDKFVLMSIPFFILGGFLMNEAKLTERLVQFANHLVGRWRGGLAQVNVVTSMFFGGITGAATADTAAIGSIMVPEMVKHGYTRRFATAVTVASSIVGPLIPPSIPMLVYGIAANASIGALFLAGLTPGVIVGLSFLILNRYLLRKMPITVGQSADVGSTGRIVGFFKSFRSAMVALVMPVIIVGGVVGGVFTPTESSAVAVLYALVVGLSMRTLSRDGIIQVVKNTAVLSATVMFVIAAANLMGWVLAFELVPQMAAQAFLSITDSPATFIFMVMILLLVTGLFLETSSAIIILTPVLLPVAKAYGFGDIHFGVVMVFGLVIGLITPPVGLCLFIGSSIGKVPVHVLSRELLPFIGVLIVLYFLFAYVPQVSVWLPQMME